MFVIKYRTFCWWLLSDQGSESGSQGGEVRWSLHSYCNTLAVFSLQCVHRDLACRNVLLGKNYIPMVSDFGLARDIYESGAYETTSGVWQCFIFFFNFYFFYKWMQNLGITEWQAQSRRCRILRGLFSRAQMSLVVLQLACKEGVFCNASDNAIRRTNFLSQSWTLKLTESWRE